MNANPRRAAALELLAATGMWKSNYAPPFLRLLWWLGIDAPPPHFASFWSNALGLGIYFGLFWGVMMKFFVWPRQTASSETVIIGACFAGAFFGLTMASYYASGRRKYGLPTWQDLGARVGDRADQDSRKP